MGEFKDASLWMKVAFLLTTLGKLLFLFGLVGGLGTIDTGTKDSIEAMFVLAIIFWIASKFLKLL